MAAGVMEAGIPDGSWFDKLVEFILDQEGSEPSEDGGVDGKFYRWGLCEEDIQEFRLRVNYDSGDRALTVETLTRDEAREIYRAVYWFAIWDRVTPHFSVVLFNARVNGGYIAVLKALQGLVGVKVDGWIGPKTIAAMNGWEGIGAGRLNKIVAPMLDFYLTRKGETYDVGWGRRCLAMLQLMQGFGPRR